MSFGGGDGGGISIYVCTYVVCKLGLVCENLRVTHLLLDPHEKWVTAQPNRACLTRSTFPTYFCYSLR